MLHETSNGQPIDDEAIERMAAEAEAGYDAASLRRKGGRPRMGSGPAEVVPVRLDPELKSMVESRAAADHTSASEVIRAALRRYLGAA